MSTQPATPVRRFRGPLLLGALLAAVVTVPILIPGSPDPVGARRYGGRRYDYGARITRCKSRCAGTGGAIRACIARDVKLAVKNCKVTHAADKAACGADAGCKGDAGSRFRLCVKSAGAQGKDERKQLSGRGRGGGYCGNCCQRTRGELSCLGAFSSSRFYGSRRYKGRLKCTGGDTGTGRGGSCEAQCDQVALDAARACGRGKGSDPECQSRVEQGRQSCIRRCQGGSPSGAFAPSVTDAIRSRLARMVPWLVNGWPPAEEP